MREVFRSERALVYEGDSAALLDVVVPGSADALLTDPPAGVGFMGRKWDKARNRREFADLVQPSFEAALAALKPGAHGLVWALPRTCHWTGVALEDAGFDVQDQVDHLFAQGFAKVSDLAKLIEAGGGPESIRRMQMGDDYVPSGRGRANYDHGGGAEMNGSVGAWEPQTEAGKRWRDWRTALKPAREVWWLVRKPLGETTVARNVLAHGTGAMNIGACRIPRGPGDRTEYGVDGDEGVGSQTTYAFRLQDRSAYVPDPAGRWPANVVLGHGVDCGAECVPGCPVAELERQEPGAARFFFAAKPTRTEKNTGLGQRNSHPTVKPVALMRYFCRLIAPPGGLVLDPFAGSGTSGVAALQEGLKFVGFEREPEHAAEAAARVAAAS